MIIEENWAISIERARRFWESQPDVTKDADGYCLGSCRITLCEPAPGPKGLFSLPRTLLRIEGPEAEVSSFHYRFWIRFLSAGG